MPTVSVITAFYNQGGFLLECLQSVSLAGDFLKCDATKNYLPGQDYWGTDFVSTAELLTTMFTGRHFFQQNSLFSRDLFEKFGGFESLKLAEDFDLTVRFALGGVLPRYLAGPLYFHRMHNNNTTPKEYQTNKSKHNQDVANFFGKYRNRLQEVLSLQEFKKVEEFTTGVA